ncbi:hypothetical protein Loa_00673 [Legionella oakridgensis ATCC 33761 = DSM 21215]|uniref:Uncharacterized protein n=2 Tax=Legionella oakridgensis TaxID=29423 RepID=W0BC98_9GAMM|nr:hypothetical protein [Legionella oakridgensis]AHE66242.1 hypothetical protein Loa_00673 [Legionella oakridgensis ATCC 33761 = DSM 21215]
MVNNLVHNAQFLISAKRAVGEEFEDFRELINRIFVGQKALYFAHYTKRHQKYDYQQLLQQIQADLEQLKTIVAAGVIPNSILGAMHEAPH